MQDLQGQLQLSRLLSEESQKTQAALDQLQAKSVAVLSENAVLHSSYDKMRQVASQAIGQTQTMQKEAADIVHRLNAQHGQEREVYFHASCYLSIGQLWLCVVMPYWGCMYCSRPHGNC